MHPLFLHLPIGAFMYLATAEVWRLFTKTKSIPGAYPVLLFGTANSVLAALAGLLLYQQGEYSGELVDQHLIWGVVFALCSVIVLIAATAKGSDSGAYRSTILGSAAALTVAGHWGGLITHGDPLKPILASTKTEQDFSQVPLTSYHVVDRIFENKCYSCHAQDTKQKGGLLMDSYAALIAGGKKGTSLVPGDIKESRLSSYVHLPLDDELHMPPEGKPQLTEEEISFMDQWIGSGAPETLELASHDFPSELTTWALAYMGAPVMQQEATKLADDEPSVDVLAPHIAKVEAVIENSIFRLGPGGEALTFTAVNARNAITDETLAALHPLADSLIEIDLSGSNVSSQALHHLLEKSVNLQRLNLSNTTVDSTWMPVATKLPSLQSLILFGTELDDQDVKQLAKMQQLEKLYLAGTGISENQVTALRSRLATAELIADDYLASHQPVSKEKIVAAKTAPSSDTDTSSKFKNLALDASISADSFYHQGTESFPAKNLNDQREADSGSSGNWSFWLAEDNKTGTVTLDLQQAYRVSTVEIQNTRNRHYADRGLKSFTLEGSLDGKNYTKILSSDLAHPSEANGKDYPFHSYTLDKSPLRYLRIVGESHYGASGGLNEIRVFAKP